MLLPWMPFLSFWTIVSSSHGRVLGLTPPSHTHRAALALEPNNVDALKGYANLIRASAGLGGRNAGSEEAHEEAQEVYRKALEVVPGDSSLMFGLASVHVEAYEGALDGVHRSEGMHEEGLRLMQDVLRRHPTHVGAMAGVLTLIAERDPPKVV